MRRHQDLYRRGDMGQHIYFIESGSIRLTTQSPAGKECLLRLQIAGEILGEHALVGAGGRPETATARESAVVWQLPAEEFVRGLRSRALCEDFMLALIHRVKEQERHITDLVTEPSRRRLGKIMLLVGQRIGTRNGDEMRIDLWISHDEWAGMVGTTRPRVSTFFCDFKRLNLISVTRERHLIIREKRLLRFLGEF